MREQMNRSDEINELVAAMAKAAASIENAKINRVNPHFKSKYADLASCFDAVRKPLGANGLVVAQTTEIRENSFVLVTTLAHASGQWIKSEYPLPTTGRPQELGSALTYARRYSLSAITGISADEDDDAETAERQTTANGNKRTAEPKFITVVQQNEIANLLTAHGRSVEDFCVFGRIGDLSELSADRYEAAIAAVKRDSWQIKQ